MDCPPELWGNSVPGTGVQLQYWDPTAAALRFLSVFHYASKLPQEVAA